MKLRTFYSFFIAATFFYQCNTHSGQTTRVSLNISAPIGEKVYLIKVPYIDEKNKIIDSAITKGLKDSIIFIIPLEQDRLFEIRVKNTSHKFNFIADAPYIHIRASTFSGQYEITGSVVTMSLKDFNLRQTEIMLHAQSVYVKADSLTKRGNPADKTLADSLQRMFKDSINFIKQRNLHYADTVRNAAAFLSVFSNIDFDDKDRADLKKLVLNAGNRFPQSEPVQKLKQETLNMISIFEEEFNIGDNIPPIELPDINGNMFSTVSLKGKYYLIDFWAPWCKNCLMYDPYKREIYEKISSDKFEMISVALDDDKKTWSDFMKKSNYDWTQLIDEKMWRGAAATTLKFDSIPFNFLVSPQGRILAKAIKPDSLTAVLERTIK